MLCMQLACSLPNHLISNVYSRGRSDNFQYARQFPIRSPSNLLIEYKCVSEYNCCIRCILKLLPHNVFSQSVFRSGQASLRTDCRFIGRSNKVHHYDDRSWHSPIKSNHLEDCARECWPTDTCSSLHDSLRT